MMEKYNAALIGEWAENILRNGRKEATATEEYVDPFQPDMYVFQSVCANRFVRFERDGKFAFYAYFQPCYDKRAPLAVHTPGYGGEMSFHPEMATRWNVLHISPLGYNTPRGKDRTKMTMNGCGAVYPETLLSGGVHGYADWLTDCVTAIEWARKQSCVDSSRIAFFGTSQGGGAAMLLSSIYSEERENGERIVRAAAAEEPFLTDFRTAAGRGAYGMGADLIAGLSEETKKKAEFYADTLHHTHRIFCPVLLTAGGKDGTCPAETVENLYRALVGTKSYTYFENAPHGYSREFLAMAAAWFSIYL